ncbi:CBS domain containing membrane protein [Methanofollis liminatans DSM 4140]|uniref:CBS domain containing membrane protein n=1 Tax=Methanofollis liminatans DSM 4140 TaxID=28892 RepID=J1L0S1_9EURY|nr:CBS domain-containing protein [Methanofollis liminatans]EJG06597.1 CBS domain containing membrane protein [Methanofollis liminatans DSM 4140]
MKAEDVMSSPVRVVAPEDTVAHARNQMIKHKISRVLVMEGDRLAGIITKKDLAYRLRNTDPIWRRRPIDRIPVSLLMTPAPLVVDPETSIRDLAALMLDRMISGIPVVNSGEVVGIVTKSDILRSASVQKLDVPVTTLMEEAVTVSRYHSLDHVVDLFSESGGKLIVVNNDGTLAGIITETNLAFYEYANEAGGIPEKDIKMLRKETSGGRKSFRYVQEASAVAEDVMTHPVVTADPETTAAAAVKMMVDHHINSVVIARGSEILGIVKRDNILQEVAK